MFHNFCNRHCVGVTREPPENQNWYCHKCGATQNSSGSQSEKRGDEHPRIRRPNMTNRSRPPSSASNQVPILTSKSGPNENPSNLDKSPRISPLPFFPSTNSAAAASLQPPFLPSSNFSLNNLNNKKNKKSLK